MARRIPRDLTSRLALLYDSGLTVSRAYAKFNQSLPTVVTTSNEKLFKFDDKKLFESISENLLIEIQNLRGGSANQDRVILILECMRRMLLCKAIFKSTEKGNITPIIEALKIESPKLQLAAVNAVANILNFNGHTGQSEQAILSWEQNAKGDFEEAAGFLILTTILFKRELSLFICFYRTLSFLDDERMPLYCSILRLIALTLTHKSKSTSPSVCQSILKIVEPRISELLQHLCSSNHQLSESIRNRFSHVSRILIQRFHFSCYHPCRPRSSEAHS